MSAAFSVEDMIDVGHPSVPGHFPGQPIVPGVLLLCRVIAAIEKCFPQADVVGARKIRFHTPLIPGERFNIQMRAEGGASLQFEVEREGERIASGQFLLGSEGEAGTACDA